jgi:deoxyribose-phosphate aldolase
VDIQEVIEELIILANVRRHFSTRADELDQIIDLDIVISREVQALQEKIPGALVVWDETTKMYGIYPCDR